MNDTLQGLHIAPLDLGIETAGGRMTVILPKNKTIPTKRTRIFTTNNDNQSVVNIKVFEGVKSITKLNRLLGQLQLGGIQRAPRGVLPIKVTLEIDAERTLRVSAKCEGLSSVSEEPLTWSASEARDDFCEMEQSVEEDDASCSVALHTSDCGSCPNSSLCAIEEID